MPNARAAAMLSALSSTKIDSVRRDAHARARQLVDLGLRLAHADVAGVDDLLEQLVDGDHRAPVVAELLDVVRQQTESQPARLQLADLVHHHPVDTGCGRAHEPSVRVHVDGLAEHRGRLGDDVRVVRRHVDLALLEQMPVGLVGDPARDLGRIGIVAHPLGDRTALDPDVVRLAEHQPQERTLGISLRPPRTRRYRRTAGSRSRRRSRRSPC